VFSLNNPAFLSPPGIRCLKCKGNQITVETARPSWDDPDASSEERSTQVDYWWCDDCGDNVAIGLGTQNEVTGEVEWLKTYPDAASKGTQGVEHVEPKQPRYEVRCDRRRVEIITLDGSLPSIDEVLREYVHPPLQVTSRASALAFAWLVLEEIHGNERAREATVDFENAEIMGNGILAELQSVAHGEG